MARPSRPIRTRKMWELDLAIRVTGICFVLGFIVIYFRDNLGMTVAWYVLPLGAGFLFIVWALALVRLTQRNARRKTLEQLQALLPDEFEDWVAARFRELGYTVRRTGMGGDHGADLLAERPGELAIVQCKRYKTWSVGEPALRDLYGAMHDFGAQRAYLVTTGALSEPARRWVRGKPIEVWDGETLARLGREAAGRPAPLPTATANPAPPRPEAVAPLPASPAASAAPAYSSPQGGTVGGGPICPRCGAPLVVRTQRQTGEQFLGCSTFPRCRHTQPLGR